MITHAIVSAEYKVKVFLRVKDYFHRFYSPSNPSLVATVEKIDVVLNSALEARFEAKEEEFAKVESITTRKSILTTMH